VSKEDKGTDRVSTPLPLSRRAMLGTTGAVASVVIGISNGFADVKQPTGFGAPLVELHITFGKTFV